jgi:ArsR family transcriptional regulator
MKHAYIRVFRAFTDENRLRVLELLARGEQCACVLLDDLRISQPTLSHHMKILCASGIVKSRRAGKWNYYTIDAEGCAYARRLLETVAKHDMQRVLRIVRALRRLLHPFGALSKAKAAAHRLCRSLLRLHGRGGLELRRRDGMRRLRRFSKPHPGRRICESTNA